MDYYSRLGPIDPQIETQSGRWASALGYLVRYDKLIEKAEEGKITTAEIQILVSHFDQADLYRWEQERELSIELLKEWLVQYKFKDWTETRTSKTPVTEQMKVEAAAKVAETLNNTDRWHIHGHGISMGVLDKEVGLIIDDLERSPQRHTAVRNYYELQADYMLRRGHAGVVHIAGSYQPYLWRRDGKDV